jgi:aryl-alcohol dehydrogenase-like predicted oxidoreductase
MTFGTAWGWGCDAPEAARIVDGFAAAGGNFIDTSCNYTDGESETIVGDVVAADRDHWVVATKYSLTERPADPNFGGNHRKNLVRSLEASLRRLGTDHVDLFWLHMWDGTTRIDEIVRALDDQVTAGKVLHLGFSDAPAWVVARAVTLAEQRGWAVPTAVQAPWSLLDRGIEDDVIPMAAALDLAVTPWGLLEGGELSGKHAAGPVDGARSRDIDARTRDALAVLQEVADEAKAEPAQVAIAYVRQRADAAVVVPILGARSRAQLDTNLGALDVTLDDEQLQRLDRASGYRRRFPRSFLESEHVRGLVFGETFTAIDVHRRAS